MSVGADEILKAQGVVLADSRVRVMTDAVSFDEQQRRASAISDIENADFVQSAFRSSRSEVSQQCSSCQRFGQTYDGWYASALKAWTTSVSCDMAAVWQLSVFGIRGVRLAKNDIDSVLQKNCGFRFSFVTWLQSGNLVCLALGVCG